MRTSPFPQHLKPFGSFTVQERLGVGEWAESFATPAASGRWTAFACGVEEDTDPGSLGDDDDLPPILLVCVVETALPRFAELRAAAEHMAEFSIEGARVVVGDGALAGLLTGANAMDAFYDHLDAVHGSLKSGAGVTMMLDGDGRGVVRVARGRDLAVLVEVEIR